MWIRTSKDNLEGYYAIEVQKDWMNQFYGKGGTLRQLTILIAHDLFKIVSSANCICGEFTAEKLFSAIIPKFELGKAIDTVLLDNGNVKFCTKKFKWTSLWYEADYLLNGYF